MSSLVSVWSDAGGEMFCFDKFNRKGAGEQVRDTGFYQWSTSELQTRHTFLHYSDKENHLLLSFVSVSTGSSERRAERKRLQTEQTHAGTFFMLFPERDKICSLTGFLLTVTTSEGFYLPSWFSDSDTLASQVTLHPSPYFFFPVSPFPSPPSPLSTSPIVLLLLLLSFSSSSPATPRKKVVYRRSDWTWFLLWLPLPLLSSRSVISLLTFDLYLQDQRLF